MNLSSLHRSHILSVDQFDRELIKELFNDVDEFRELNKQKSLDFKNILHGFVITNLFYEPSTRTSSSFYSAMSKQGGGVIPINEVTYSSVVKGETLEDTIKTLCCYSDAIVLRHNEKGAASRAAKISSKPIINAGDGTGEHPTQALLDLYTIYKHRNGNIDGLKIAFVGDLKYGRTVHSLSKLLKRLYNVKITYISRDGLGPDPENIRSDDILGNELTSKYIGDVDVIYMTRTQLERHNINEVYEPLIINKQIMDNETSLGTIVMHPLPRVSEISTDFDSDPRAMYFKQVEYGLDVRMALLRNVLLKKRKILISNGFDHNEITKYE